MTLVERFIGINGWSMSRKTALLAAIAAAGEALAGIVVHFAAVRTAAVDVGKLDRVLIGGCIAMLVSGLLSLAMVRAGREARWTAYFFVFAYACFVVALLQGLGIWSTPYMVMYPLGAVVAALWYDERVGLFTLVLGVVTGLAVEGLQYTGRLAYAPLLLARSIDAQNSFWWFQGSMGGMMIFVLFAIALASLVVMARKRQEVQLRETHAQLAATAQVMERSTQLLRRYLPAQVVDQILAGGTDLARQHERRRLSIFFSDLVGFTEIAEELEPEDLSRLLNEYFAEMTAIAHRHGGTVDELSGDAILIFFGAPNATTDKDHALRAVRMAVEMQRAMVRLNAGWHASGIAETLHVRMGINTGVVTVGNFGSPDRMKYAALGKHVNLAARLQAQCEPGNVLLSHATWLLVNDQIPCVHKGELQLKGLHRPVITYELVGEAG